MKFRTAMFSLLFFVCSCSADNKPDDQQQPAAKTINKPNILLILLDDLGVNDLGRNNQGETTTPNLDKIASRGSYFPRHYTDSTCAPSRAALLTGKRPSKLGFTPTGIGLSPDIITLPEHLRSHGYHTLHIGKWHLGHREREAWPDKQGFERWFGFLHQFELAGPREPGDTGFHQPRYFNPWLQGSDQNSQKFKGHLNNILTDKTLEFLQTPQEKPWFLNLWFMAPHTPIQAEKKYMRHGADAKGKYLALLEQLDHNIGRIIDQLESSGQLQNTVLIITSDNGGTDRHFSNNLPFSGGKGQYQEGGIRTPLIILSPVPIPETDSAVSLLDIYPTIAELAGLPLPAGLDGSSLLNHIKKPQLWVLEHPFGTTFSWLEDDGKTRYDTQHTYRYNDTTKPPEIQEIPYQLQLRNPALNSFVETLKTDRTISYEFDQVSHEKYNLVKGDDFRRVSGYGGLNLSLAIELTDTQQNQLIAEQPGHWALHLKQGQLQLEAYKTSLISKPLSAGSCHQVSINFYLGRSDLRPDLEKGWISLSAGQQTVKKELQSPSLSGRDMHGATRILKSEHFAGQISRPFLYKKGLEPSHPFENPSIVPALCNQF